MADDSATGSPEVAHSGVVSLRRELWRKHVQLRDIGPDDLRYAEAATEVLDLTARLLAAEESVASAARAAHRRTTIILYCLAVGCSAAVLATVALLPGLGPTPYRAALGAVLMAIVISGTALARWRRRRAPRRTAETGLQPPIDPVTGPLTVSRPSPARSSS